MNTHPHQNWKRFDMSRFDDAPVRREKDIARLHQELCDLVGDGLAKEFYDDHCLDLDYDGKCAAFVAEINRICETLAPRDIAAMVDMADEQARPIDAWEFLGKTIHDNSEAIDTLLAEQSRILVWRDAYLVAMRTNAHYPAVAETVDEPRADDPRDPLRIARDQDDDETRVTRASDTPR